MLKLFNGLIQRQIHLIIIVYKLLLLQIELEFNQPRDENRSTS